jgi:hypothetical protein
MNTERQQFLSLKHFPGRLTAQEAAWFLGFSSHEIPMLLGARLIKPLGHPPENGLKFFLRAELERVQDDPLWMAKACDAILKYWKSQNVKKMRAASTVRGSRTKLSISSRSADPGCRRSA